MTTATPPPVILRTLEEIQRCAESIAASELGSAPPSLRPTVQIGPHPLSGGLALQLSMPEDREGTFTVSQLLPGGTAPASDQVYATFCRAYAVALRAMVPGVALSARSAGEATFTTPEKIQEYAQGFLDPVFASAAAGMRPRVEVRPHRTDGGIVVRTHVTGEGFLGKTEEIRVYPNRRLMDEEQVRSAVWLQVSALLNGLTPIPEPDTEGDG